MYRLASWNRRHLEGLARTRHSMRRVVWVVAMVVWLTLPLTGVAGTVQVAPTVKTALVSGLTDDPAIWVHPTHPELSTIIGTDKKRGLAVYDLAGKQLQFLTGLQAGNVDIRYNFPLGKGSVDLVGINNRKNNTLEFYRIDPATRLLENVTARSIKTGTAVYGFCMYHSRETDTYYAFVTPKGNSGELQQWELFANGKGKVDATKVRSIQVGGKTEGCVADDELGFLYTSQESKGIWKYGAEPGDGAARTQVDSTRAGGHLKPDVEGLALYYAGDGTGYLIASSQGAHAFMVYTREGDNSYVMTFKVTGVTDTDGIEVVSTPLGPAFPYGVFVAQNNDQNFKLVPWQLIADAVTPALTIDTAWEPGDLAWR